jgi:hypothetical protein
VVAPRFVLVRPSGATSPTLFAPDIPFDPGRSLGELVHEAALEEIVTTSHK